MKSIYDMMGRCTHPALQDSAPAEHVELFFQVTPSCLVPPCQPPTPPGCHRPGLPPPPGPSPLSPCCSFAEDGQER